MNKLISKSIATCMAVSIIGVYACPVFAMEKEETVYGKLKSTGDIYETIVSDHLKNTEREKLLNDMSDLLNIKNVNGDETFEKDGNSICWNAEENDIYYQGETEKKLPIECNIKYFLDGKEISPDDLAGKSGKVRIEISYKNKDKHEVMINGKNEVLYTPFVIVAGTIIDNKDCRNISITNGKIIDNGQKSIVIGLAFPGLEESLAAEDVELDIPDNIIIELETSDFSMDSIMSFVTPKLIEEDDFGDFSKMGEIYDKVNVLKSSSKTIENGANELKTGIGTYTEKSEEFYNAVTKVSNGINTVNDNYSKINSGIHTLNTSSKELKSGAEQINGGISLIDENLKVISDKLEVASNSSKELAEGQERFMAGINTFAGALNSVSGNDMSLEKAELESLANANNNAKIGIETMNEKLQEQVSALDSIINRIEDEEEIKLLESQKQLLQAQISANNRNNYSLRDKPICNK